MARFTARERASRRRSACLAGSLGVLALLAFESVERRALGRAPVYAASVVERRLLGARDLKLALAVSMVYGSALAVAYAQVRPSLPRAASLAGLTLGATVYVAEMLLLPRVGAVPRLARWGLRERALLAAHTMVYGITTAFAFDAMTARPRL